MNYSDSLHQSSEYLRMALRHMGKLSVPVDPINYAVWYEYVSGRNQDLKKVIEDFLQNSRPITDEVNKDLYNSYVAEEDQSVIERVRTEFKRIIADMLKHLSRTGGEISRYGEALAGLSDRLAETIDPAVIRQIVESIRSETRTMESSSEGLRGRLEATSREIEILRKDLERVRREATTDALTGVANRRAFDERLAQAMDKAGAEGTPLSLILMDIDLFKRVNDRHGHLVGDKVIRTTAQMIKNEVKGKDLVARFGGEEFAAVLPETSHEGALALAEQIRARFEAKQWRRKDTGEYVGVITLSIGVATYRPPEEAAEFIDRADRALYRAKESGRNRVCGETAEGAKAEGA